MGANVRDRAGHFDPRIARQRLDLRRRISAHQGQARSRPALPHRRPDLPTEPDRAVHVGRVIHRPDEDAAARLLVRGTGRREVVQIDPVGHRVDRAGRADLAEETRLRLRDEQDGPRPAGQSPLEPSHARPFQPIQPGARGVARGGVIEPLLAVHVHEVDDRRHVAQPGLHQVRGHARGRRDRRVEAHSPRPGSKDARQSRHPESPLADRTTRRYGIQGVQPAPPIQGDYGHFPAERPQHRLGLRVDRFVRQAGQRDIGARRQEAEHVKAPNPVPLVRRIGDAMRHVQDPRPGGRGHGNEQISGCRGSLRGGCSTLRGRPW